MSVNLYKILGVRKNATFDQIKQAYRNKAKTLHPDTGGDVDAFNELKLAFDVLFDAERRARYDKSGEFEETPAEVNPIQAVVGEISNLIHAAVVHPNDPNSVDLIVAIREAAIAKLNEVSQERAKIEMAVKRLKRMVGRFKTRKPENHLDLVVRHHLEQATQTLKQADKVLQHWRDVIAFLADYQYAPELEAMPQGLFVTLELRR